MIDERTPMGLSERAQQVLSDIANNWGSEAILDAPPGNLAALVNRQPKTQLVTVDMLSVAPIDVAMFVPGSWVVVLTAEVVNPNPNTQVGFLPIIAEVQLGTGGTQQVLEVDAYKAVIPLPSVYTKISIAWDQLDAGTIEGLTALGYQLPSQVRIKATVQRSFADSELLTRTTTVAWAAGSATVRNRPVIVPPLAKCWKLWTPDYNAYEAASPAYFEFEGTNPADPLTGPLVDQDADAARITRFARNKCCRPYHPRAAAVNQVLFLDPSEDIVLYHVSEIGL